jgi:hypothetical protein
VSSLANIIFAHSLRSLHGTGSLRTPGHGCELGRGAQSSPGWGEETVGLKLSSRLWDGRTVLTTVGSLVAECI